MDPDSRGRDGAWAHTLAQGITAALASLKQRAIAARSENEMLRRMAGDAMLASEPGGGDAAQPPPPRKGSAKGRTMGATTPPGTKNSTQRHTRR